jgi:hypothetical protein
VVVLLGVLIAPALRASAQVVPAPETAPDASAQGALLEPLSVSPRGAFLRSVLVPGWGHVSIGSPARGGFYFALEAASLYALLRTRFRLSEARDRAALREVVVRDRLAQEGITTPEEVQAALAGDERLASFQDLIDSRESQQEDLVAWGIFLLFLSGADAYVSAHLGRFPEPIQVQVTPVDSDRAEVALRVLIEPIHGTIAAQHPPDHPQRSPGVLGPLLGRDGRSSREGTRSRRSRPKPGCGAR